jgi:hypothetical protein
MKLGFGLHVRTIAEVMIRSLQTSLCAMNHLLRRTVETERMKVTIVIHATKFTSGPLCVDEISGLRVANIVKSAAAIESKLADTSELNNFVMHRLRRQQQRSEEEHFNANRKSPCLEWRYRTEDINEVQMCPRSSRSSVHFLPRAPPR